jgi:hypothetical protein
MTVPDTMDFDDMNLEEFKDEFGASFVKVGREIVINC